VCAKAMPGSIRRPWRWTMAHAAACHAPEATCRKLQIRYRLAKGRSRNGSAARHDNVRRLAKDKGVDPSAITLLGRIPAAIADLINSVRLDVPLFA